MHGIGRGRMPLAFIGTLYGRVRLVRRMSAAGLVGMLALTPLGSSVPSQQANAQVDAVTTIAEYLDETYFPVFPTTAMPGQPAFDAVSATDELLYGSSMTAFLQAKSENRNANELNWSTDDCSNPLIGEPSRSQPAGFDFRNPCWRHDFGYGNYKRQGRFDESSRRQIDDNFHRDTYAVCDRYSGWNAWRGVSCRRIADAYYEAVRACGYDNSSPGCVDRARSLVGIIWSR